MIEQYYVSYTPEAYRDLGDMYSYFGLRLHAKRVAVNLVKYVQKEISILTICPEQYSLVDWEPWASMGVRKLSADHLIAYYQLDISRKAVTVIRIFLVQEI